MTIEYIADIKTWFDSQNGNSYFSGQIFDLSRGTVAVLPFQYGYGSHPEDVVVKPIQNHEGTDEHRHDTRRRIHFSKNPALKRECVAYGTA